MNPKDFKVLSRSKRHSNAACYKPWIHFWSLKMRGIIKGSKPWGRWRYNTSFIGEYRNAFFISILERIRDSEAAILNHTLILLWDAASAKVSKNVESSWWLPWATRRALNLLIDPSAFIQMLKITLLGTMRFEGIVLISKGEVSIFLDIKDWISFDNEKNFLR